MAGTWGSRTRHRSGDGQASDARVVLVIEAQYESDRLPTCGKLFRNDLSSGFHPNQACGCFIGGFEAFRSVATS
jgi:hypothetical protein